MVANDTMKINTLTFSLWPRAHFSCAITILMFAITLVMGVARVPDALLAYCYSNQLQQALVLTS